jgi:hypothetical protein
MDNRRMVDSKLTPTEHASNAHFGRVIEKNTFDYLANASPRELMEFINFFPPHQNSHWFHKAKVVLDVRLAEDAAATAEKMTQQNAILVNESRALTKYTKGLYVFTVLLFVVAILQVIIMVRDSFFKTESMTIPPTTPIETNK